MARMMHREKTRGLVIYVEYMTSTGHTRDSFFSIKPIELSHAKIYIPPRAIVLGEREKKIHITNKIYRSAYVCVVFASYKYPSHGKNMTFTLRNRL